MRSAPKVKGSTMAASIGKRPPSSIISLRVPRRTQDLIDRAARALDKTRTEFVLESAARAAEDALLDRRVFILDAAQYAAFERALDAPPQPSGALRKLLSEPAPWEG
jgi:uncharacterized protein (DUF1778 family)